MFRTFLLVASLIVITFVLGCSDNISTPKIVETNSLLPLKVGNTWNYKIYNRFSDSTGQVNWIITKKISVDGKEYFLISSTTFGNEYFVARNEDNGFSLSTYDTTNGITSPFFFKYPANDNEIYQYQIPNSDSILTIKVTKETIAINNKNYDCYGYTNENLNPYFPFMYFSENIGLVRHKLVFYSVNRIDTTNYIIYDLQNEELK